MSVRHGCSAAIGVGLLFALIGGASAQPPEDGFYQRSDDEAAAFVLDQEGRRVTLGAVREVAIQWSSIRSEDNANSTFWVQLGVAEEVHVQAAQYVLVVANRAYPWAGSGGGNGEYEIDFRVSGAENARDIGRFLNTPIEYRKHPGHQLLVSFTPVQRSFRVGEEVAVYFRIENVGASPIAFLKGGHYRGSTRDNQYTFSARFLDKQVADIGSSIHFGGLAGQRVLGPGEVFTERVSLGRWFAFRDRGRYEVFGSYVLTLVDPGGTTLGPIWQDFAGGAFTVMVD